MFKADKRAKNSKILKPKLRVVIAKSEADTIKIALRMLLAAIILDKYLVSASFCIFA